MEFNEYYDEVIFRYLRSVKNYLTRKDLRQYAFSTIAWNAMNSAMDTYRKRMGRRVQTISYNDVIKDAEYLCYIDVLEQPNHFVETLAAQQVVFKILGLLGRRERIVVQMTADGYSLDEIAERVCSTTEKVRSILTGVRTRMSALFPEMAAEYDLTIVA